MQLDSSNSLKTCSSATEEKRTAAMLTPSATCSIRIFWRPCLSSTLEYYRCTPAHRSTIRCSTSASMFSSQHYLSSTSPLLTTNTKSKYFSGGRSCTKSVSKTSTLTLISSGGGYFMQPGRAALSSSWLTTHWKESHSTPQEGVEEYMFLATMFSVHLS